MMICSRLMMTLIFQSGGRIIHESHLQATMEFKEVRRLGREEHLVRMMLCHDEVRPKVQAKAQARVQEKVLQRGLT